MSTHGTSLTTKLERVGYSIRVRVRTLQKNETPVGASRRLTVAERDTLILILNVAGAQLRNGVGCHTSQRTYEPALHDFAGRINGSVIPVLLFLLQSHFLGRQYLGVRGVLEAGG